MHACKIKTIQYIPSIICKNMDKELNDYFNEVKSLQDILNDNWTRPDKLSELSLCFVKQTKPSLIKTKQLFKTIFSNSEFEDEKFSDILLNVLNLFNIPKSSSNEEANEQVHHNLCLMLLNVTEHYNTTENTFILNKICNKILDYLNKTLELCTNEDTKLYAMLSIEKICLNLNYSDEQIRIILKNIKKLSTNSTNLKKIAFCSKWCIDRVFGKTQTFNQVPSIKFSTDRLIVRNESLQPIPVRSQFGIKLNSKSIYYYEVICHTIASIRIGWVTKECKLNEHEQIGDDQNSICFDTGKRRVIHNKSEHKCTNSEMDNFKEGDSIVCLINFKTKIFSFYLNNTEINYLTLCEEVISFSSEPYYPAVSLSFHQQLQFNFGPCQFVSTLNAQNFDSETNGNARKYYLLEPIFSDGVYWFKQDSVDNQVEQFFDDEIQEPFCKVIIDLEARIANDYFDQEYSKSLSTDFENLMNDDKKHPFLRIIQAIITELGNRVNDHKLDFTVGLIERYLKHYSQIKTLPTHNSLLEIINPYMHLSPKCPCEPNTKMKRNILIVISIMFKLYNNENYFKYDDVYRFLVNTLAESNDNWSLLFALICLEKIATKNDLLKRKNLATKVKAAIERLSRNLGKFSPTTIFSSINDILQYQIGFLAKWYDQYVGLDAKLDFVPTVKIQCNDFSVRYDENDYITLRASHPATCFQVLLFTSGQIRIGWTTRDRQLKKGDQLGKDDHDSIGFDGCSRIIYHNKKEYTVDNVHWKAGDVVSCVIADDFRQKFEFYLNDKQILAKNFDETYQRPSQSYYPAVSLSAHQHCYFNFGLENFIKTPNKVKEKLNFRKESMKNCRMLEPCFSDEMIWFKQNKFDSIFVFEDKLQEKFDKILNNPEDSSIETFQRGIEAVKNEKQSTLRMIQSIVKVKHKLTPCNHKLTLLAEWITNQSETNVLQLSEFFELIYPYMNKEHSYEYTENVAILLLIMSKIEKYNSKIISEPETYAFLERILSMSDKIQRRFLIALIALENFSKIFGHEEKLKNSEISQKLNIPKTYNGYEQHLYAQIDFYDEWLKDNVFTTDSRQLERHIFSRTLNPKGKTTDLKILSKDYLTIRCDIADQSVRSTRTVVADSCYYEVKIVTSGSLRIGWATDKMDLMRSKIGDCKFSVCLDVYNRCIWYANAKYDIEIAQNDWKPGAVVGCLIDGLKDPIKHDKYNIKFSFFLNGKFVVCKEVDFYANEFYAAFTLSCHQHCTVNFGATSFKNVNQVMYKNSFYNAIRKQEKEENLKRTSHTFISNSIVSDHGNVSIDGNINVDIKENLTLNNTLKNLKNQKIIEIEDIVEIENNPLAAISQNNDDLDNLNDNELEKAEKLLELQIKLLKVREMRKKKTVTNN